MQEYISLYLKSGKEKSLQRFHPWVFSGALQKDIKSTAEGEVVRVLDHKGAFLGVGYVQHGSIAVRILSFEDEIIDQDFWNKIIQKSWNTRQSLGFPSELTNCFRLMHGEGDGIPGLIIDFYNGTAVIQCHTSGVLLHINQISEALKLVLGNDLKAIYNKSKESLHSNLIEIENGFILGELTEDVVKENGFSFKIDWQTGQKTGFFLDQRDNRQLLGQYAKGKTVLNTFAYTGGFSVYALQNEASLVHSVDVSKTAIALLNQNMMMNDPLQKGNHEDFAQDTFVFFKNNQTLYDIVILDPPAFAKNIGAKHNALMGYKRLNIEGLKKVKPGGLMFTFSCSQVVDSLSFNQIIMSAAIESGRSIKIIHRLTQGADHPVNIFHPEGEYLKGLVLFVE